MDILAQLEKVGAVYTNKHFVYKSGKHGPGYIDMDPLFPNVDLLARIGDALAHLFFSTPYEAEASYPDTVAGAATGGIPLAYYTAASKYLREGTAVVWADKVGDEFEFSRAGFPEQIRGKRVLIVEDMLTTGGSVAKVCREIRLHGGKVVGVSAVVNRGNVSAHDISVPRVKSLAKVQFEAVDQVHCGLCATGVPIACDIGHGDKFKANHPDYRGGFVKLLS